MQIASSREIDLPREVPLLDAISLYNSQNSNDNTTALYSMKLGLWLAKYISFLRAKFGSNRKLRDFLLMCLVMGPQAPISATPEDNAVFALKLAYKPKCENIITSSETKFAMEIESNGCYVFMVSIA